MIGVQGTDAGVHDCWNRIGVRGDGSCPELRQHVHCRNCPVYAAAAAQLLDADAPVGYYAERSAHIAQVPTAGDEETRSVVIFRVASEWLAVPTAVVIEITNVLPIHSLPHTTNVVVLGLVSVRGELLVCVSLREVVGAEPSFTAPSAASLGNDGAAGARLLVLRREGVRVAAAVDEVHGIHRFSPAELKPLPATVAKGTGTYSTSVLAWRGHSVGTLDDQLLFYRVKRSLG